MTQTTMILAHLKTSPITPIEALQKYKCMRLAARIETLRNLGYIITTHMVQNGKGRYAKYELVK